MIESSLVRKIEKAKSYAVQRDRVKLTHYKAEFRGDNGDHTITYEAGNWHCDCHYFDGHGTCSHTMALEMMFKGLVKEPATS